MMTRWSLNRRALMAGAAATMVAPGSLRAQPKTEITISRQPGVLYMPTHVIEKQQLIEKHAARLGLAGVTVKWVNFSGGGAQQDALLASGVDVINTGTGNLQLLWDRTRGAVKGICASSAGPLIFVTRDPKIQSLRDLGAGDKIAVPTVRVSTQAILLQIWASQNLGADKWSHFDTMTVQMGHPDALIALKNAYHEVRNHFGAPPFQYYALKQVAGARALINSANIIGGPLSQAQFITTTKFADANPLAIRAVFAAAQEAKTFIEQNTKDAVEIYREITNDKTPTDELLDILAQPGMMAWDLQPQGTMKFAAHLHRIGTLKTAPQSFKDYYLPFVHDLAGS